MQRPQIDQLLPGMFQRAAGPGTVVAAVLDVMAEMHEPDEAILADIDAIFDPYRAPERFVPFLAKWVDLDRLLPPDAASGREVPFAAGYGCLRNLVAIGSELAQWRGTSAGLRWFLQVATGVAGFTVVESAADRPFHIEVQVPPEAVVHLELIERIVAMEKPAFVTATVTAAHGSPAVVDPADLPTGVVPVGDTEGVPRGSGAAPEPASVPVGATPPSEDPPPASVREGANP